MKKHIDSLSKNKGTEPAKEEQPIEETPPTEEAKPATVEKVEPTPATPEAGPTEAVTEPGEAAKAPEGTTPPEEVDKEAAGSDSFETLFPEPSVAIAGPPSWIWWLLLIIASAVLGVVGYSLAQGKLNNWFGTTKATPTASAVAKATATPSTTATPTSSATSTPTTTPTTNAVVKSAVTMRVLNGTKVTGAAATAKTTLEKAGFTVRTTGNAANQNYTSSYVYYQSGRQAEAEAVKAALSDYSITLEESTLASPDMVLVVIGKE